LFIDFSELDVEIEELHFTTNRGIKSLDPDMFRDQTHWTSMDFFACSLTSLNASMFENMTSLENLDFSGNNLRHIDAHFVTNSPKGCNRRKPNRAPLLSENTCDATYVKHSIAFGQSLVPLCWQQCPIGTFTSFNLSDECPQCPMGKFNNNHSIDPEMTTMQAVCYDCPQGKYGNESGATSIAQCRDCPHGRFSAREGVTDCAPCMSGKYAPSGSIACEVCAAGKDSPPFAEECVPCPQGFFNPEEGQKCQACQKGRYNPMLGATNQSQCLICPEGHFCDHLTKLLELTTRQPAQTRKGQEKRANQERHGKLQRKIGSIVDLSTRVHEVAIGHEIKQSEHGRDRHQVFLVHALFLDIFSVLAIQPKHKHECQGKDTGTTNQDRQIVQEFLNGPHTFSLAGRTYLVG